VQFGQLPRGRYGHRLNSARSVGRLAGRLALVTLSPVKLYFSLRCLFTLLKSKRENLSLIIWCFLLLCNKTDQHLLHCRPPPSNPPSLRVSTRICFLILWCLSIIRNKLNQTIPPSQVPTIQPSFSRQASLRSELSEGTRHLLLASDLSETVRNEASTSSLVSATWPLSWTFRSEN
jgi:hypothetical protein